MTAGNFFERCERCKACCRTSDRFVHIYVCGHEKRLIERLTMLGRDTKEILVPYAASCSFLGDGGCTLGDIKPLQCRMYPILLLKNGSLGVDPACTSSEEYLARIRDLSSDARRHLERMRAEVALISDKEKALLAEWSRYVCDVVVLPDGGQL
jgi:Fe-S-cluster containining protein